ncbi:hypothetical protein [Agrococcus casei]|uniref:hypothetical protein n=1 Tax=Agrococcus casei TaxID=343512 RepID=UPI003F8F6E62
MPENTSRYSNAPKWRAIRDFNAGAARLVRRRTARDEAAARLLAVCPDPDMLDALGHLAASGMAPSQVRFVAATFAGGGVLDG